MGSNRKTVLKGFSYLHCDDFAAYLSKMAAKGWHFKEWGAGLIFEKGTPENAQYAVEVFIDGSEYDTRPDVHTQEFAEYCEAAGWKLIDAKRKFVIFKKIRDDAVDILTPRERLENIAREERKEIWQKVFLCVTFTLLQFLQFTGSGFVNRIFSNNLLFITVLWLVLGLGALGRCIHFYVWKHQAEKKIANGNTIFFGKSANHFSFLNGWYSWITGSALFLYIVISLVTQQYMELLYIALLVFPLIIMAYFISKFRPDAVTNQLIQIIVPVILFVVVMGFFMGMIFSDQDGNVSLDEIPLTYEDIGGSAGALEDTSFDGSTSIFGSGLRCWLYYEDEHIYYYAYRSEYPWILDKIWNDEMEKKYNQNGEDVTDIWGAEVAIRNVRGDYLIRYQDAVLILNFEEDTILTPSEVDTIRAALYESR